MNHTASDFTVTPQQKAEQEFQRVNRLMREGLEGFLGKPMTEEQKERALAKVREVLDEYRASNRLIPRYRVDVVNGVLVGYDLWEVP